MSGQDIERATSLETVLKTSVSVVDHLDEEGELSAKIGHDIPEIHVHMKVYEGGILLDIIAETNDEAVLIDTKSASFKEIIDGADPELLKDIVRQLDSPSPEDVYLGDA